MAFSSFSEFVHMGGYGLYVWSSFFLTFLVIAGVALETIAATFAEGKLKKFNVVNSVLRVVRYKRVLRVEV